MINRFRTMVQSVWLTLALVAASSIGCNSSKGGNDQTPAASSAGNLKAAPAKPDADCAKCRNTWCRGEPPNNGFDLVGVCFENKPDPKVVPHPDANFAKDCQAVLDCAYKHDCAYDPARGPAHCYCGSRYVDECLAQGPAPDAPCVAEWQAATRSKDNGEILTRFSLLEYPAGWAFSLLECDRDRCGARSQFGRCTP